MPAEPKEDRQPPIRDPRKKREFLGTWPMRAADTLMRALPIDEATYQGVVGHAHHDARAYLLYGALDEVFKVCTATLRWAEFLDAPEEESKKHDASENEAEQHMHRVVIEAVLDEQHMWIRKLNELLSDLILFQSLVDISKPAIRGQAKTGHRASAQEPGCVVARFFLKEQGGVTMWIAGAEVSSGGESQSRRGCSGGYHDSPPW